MTNIFNTQGGAGEEKGEYARMSAFIGAIAIADLVKTTLGPKGMDKILQSMGDPNQKITITNDGATILKSIPIDNAAARILVDTSKTQDAEVGDGTTSVAGESTSNRRQTCSPPASAALCCYTEKVSLSALCCSSSPVPHTYTHAHAHAHAHSIPPVLAGELLREAEKLVNQKIHPQTIIRGWRKAVTVAREALRKSSLDNSADAAAFREEYVVQRNAMQCNFDAISCCFSLLCLLL
jgi:chaperonin GroEL (HSP60 family)